MDDCDVKMCGEYSVEGTRLQNEILIKINHFEKICKIKKVAIICVHEFKKTKRSNEKICITKRIKLSFVLPKFRINVKTPIFHKQQNTNMKHCEFPEISVMIIFHLNLTKY